jgi:hypothetical protein
MKIKYTIVGELYIPDSIYSDEYEGDIDWNELTDEQKAAEVKSVEEDTGYEAIFDDCANGKVTIEVSVR